MSGFPNFYNVEYLSERLAAVCKERDELRRMLKEYKPVVHAKWIHKGQRVHLGVNWWACSVCGGESGAQWMRYCPNCGARMDGE